MDSSITTTAVSTADITYSSLNAGGSATTTDSHNYNNNNNIANISTNNVLNNTDNIVTNNGYVNNLTTSNTIQEPSTESSKPRASLDHTFWYLVGGMDRNNSVTVPTKHTDSSGNNKDSNSDGNNRNNSSSKNIDIHHALKIGLL